MDINHILVPTDFSPQADNALDFAVDLAAKAQSEVHLLFVAELSMNLLDPPIGEEPDPDEQLETMVTKAKLRMDEIIAKYGSGVSINLVCVKGQFEDEITKCIDEFRIDLVVMGRTGSSGMKRMIMGSNTEDTMRLARCPVLAIDSSVSTDDIKKIILGFDMTSKASKVISRLKAIQIALGAKLVLTCVKTSSVRSSEAEIMSEMKDFVEKNEIENCEMLIHNDSSAASGLLNFANESNGDMMAFAKSRRVGLRQFFTKSISEDVVSHSILPIWSMNAE